MHIRRSDVVVLRKAVTGVKDTSGRPMGREAKGSQARVLKVLKDQGKIIVEGVNYKYRHVRPSQKNPQGGRIAKEAPISISNVMLYCPKCDKGVRVRVDRVPKDPTAEGKAMNVVRYCKVCGEMVGGQE